MEEYRRIKEDTPVIWKLRKTFAKLGIGELQMKDYFWFTSNMHKKSFNQIGGD